MITIDWQVIAQYDNDRLTSNDAQYDHKIDWQEKAHMTTIDWRSESAIW